jgi:L-ascorbate metabolism protein UlaG (beta-lactamase superfamily)
MPLIKRIMIYFVILLGLAGVAIFVFLQSPVFGANPSGTRLARIEKSPRYRDGVFQNAEPTVVMLPNVSFFKLTTEFLFNKPGNTEPSLPLPVVKANLSALPAAQPVIVWFGHSSYLIKSGDVSVLVDPVFAGVSPVPGFGQPFAMTYAYTAADMPAVDVLLLTHDHYDHLDFSSIKKLHPRAKRIVTSLGVGAHLERWGVPAEKIIELDWWEDAALSPDVKFTATPARHFSGRSFARGKTAWSSFVLQLHGHKLFLGGDSGYDGQFKVIGDKFGPFHLALLECGQYGVNWPYIHMAPEQTVQASIDLQASVLMPVHWAKFSLAFHAWDEPIERLLKQATTDSVRVLTPKIGEVVELGKSYPANPWWRQLK